MNNVHDNAPVVFRTRWALSYLCGPLTRNQIKRLTATEATESAQEAPEAASKPQKAPQPTANVPASGAAADTGDRPLLSPKIKEAFLEPDGGARTGSRLLYRPVLLGRAELHYASSSAGVDIWRRIACFAPLTEGQLQDPWAPDNEIATTDPVLQDIPQEEAAFIALPKAAAEPKRYTGWQKRFKTHLYRDRVLELQRCKALKLVQRPDESLADFAARRAQTARERRDLEIEKLRQRYAPKLAQIQERIAKAELRLKSEEAEYSKEKWDTAISIGGTLLGALFGRKTSGRISTSDLEKDFSQTADARSDVMKAQQAKELETKKLADLSASLEKELAAKRDSLDPGLLETDSLTIRPRKSDLAVSEILLLWRPWWVDGDGAEEAAFASPD
jgi:hypothetical protein